MIETYSINKIVAQNGSVAWDNVNVKKGCTAELVAPATINLNKCGVYHVGVVANAATAATIQLFKDGVALPQTESTGTTMAFSTLVQVTENNNGCCCSSPTKLQVVNVGSAEATLSSIDMIVTKIC